MLCFLKLGGSLITDKSKPHTPNLEVIQRAAFEIASAWRQLPDLKLVIGHGSGSFGHAAAKKYNTRQGVQTAADWQGFAEVWKEARLLNQLVLEALFDQNLPVVSFPPSASVVTSDGSPTQWDRQPLQDALAHGLIPVTQGDTVFDRVRGGTILSTEEVFVHLGRILKPGRILFAGQEAGVWQDYPACTRLVEKITPATYAGVSAAVIGSAWVDVTGGMAQKVTAMLELAAEIPGFEARIFSGAQAGQIQAAMLGQPVGTLITL
jgi:isopentenyl phosphate kinase